MFDGNSNEIESRRRPTESGMAVCASPDLLHAVAWERSLSCDIVQPSHSPAKQSRPPLGPKVVQALSGQSLGYRRPGVDTDLSLQSSLCGSPDKAETLGAEKFNKLVEHYHVRVFTILHARSFEWLWRANHH